MTVVVSSILPAQDPAFEKSSKWRNIPEWSEAVGAACAENGIPFADNTEICQTYADLWAAGRHPRPPGILPLLGCQSDPWPAGTAPQKRRMQTNETENDPA